MATRPLAHRLIENLGKGVFVALPSARRVRSAPGAVRVASVHRIRVNIYPLFVFQTHDAFIDQVGPGARRSWPQRRESMAVSCSLPRG